MVARVQGFDHYELTRVEVGGERVGYTRSSQTLHLAGKDLSIAEWLEIRRRIDLILKHEMGEADWQALKEKMAWMGKLDRLPPGLREHEAPRGQPANNFISQNFEFLNGLGEGEAKRPPWWLSWLYQAVATKGKGG